MTRRLFTCCRCIVLAATLALAPACAAQITVTATAKRPDGSPMEGIPIKYLPNRGQGLYGGGLLQFTNEAGWAVFTVTPAPDVTHVFVSIAGPGFSPGIPFAQLAAFEEQTNRLIREYSFPAFVALKLEAGQTEYSAEIVLKPAVTATIQLVDAQGAPIVGGAVWASSGRDMAYHTGDNSGPLTIGGIPQGESAEVYIFGGIHVGSPEPTIIELTPADTIADFNRTVTINPYTPGEATARIKRTNQQGLLTRRVEGTQGGIVLFTPDAARVYCFGFSPESNLAVIIQPQGNVSPQIDPGDYYLAPGGPGFTPFRMLRDLLERGIDVDQYNVPKLTLQAGDNPEFIFDMTAAEQAIIEAFEDN